MPLTSPTALQAALSGWTQELFLECLTFDHASISPIRLVADKVDLTRSAGTFTAFPFEFRLHTKADDQIPEAEIFADNIDRQITQALRALSGTRPTVTYELVLHSSPNTIEIGPVVFEAMGFKVDAGSITVRISFAFSILNDAWPKDYFAPWNAA